MDTKMAYSALTTLICNVTKTYWSIAVGFLFSTIIAHFFIKWIIDSLWCQMGKARESKTLSTVQGYLERFLYTAFYYMGHPSFIGFWPVLKVASQWKHWSERAGYNIMLIGTALSIIYGVTGAKLAQWLANAQWVKSIFVPVVLIAISVFLRIWIKKQPIEKEKDQRNKANAADAKSRAAD
jgi:fatty acid desaturase